MDILDQIVALSHEFGTTDYVQGGGGNTSVKQGNTLWIKPSGTTLATLDRDSLLAIDRARLGAVYSLIPPDNVTEREALVTRMLADARCDSNVPRRPSVEAPLHDSLDATFVVHTHPALVGGLVCSANSTDACAQLFPDALYVPPTNPGYELAMRTRASIHAYAARRGRQPAVIFMENHGVVVAGDTPDAVRSLYAHIMGTLHKAYRTAGIATTLPAVEAPSPSLTDPLIRRVQATSGHAEELAHTVTDGRFPVAPGPISPDHIVYMKSYAFFGEPTEAALTAFHSAHGYWPRVVATKTAVLAFGSSARNAALAMTLARDGALWVQLAEAFGGIRYMSDTERIFIENWEAESYRQKVTT